MARVEAGGIWRACAAAALVVAMPGVGHLRADTSAALRGTVIAMAQHFVQEYYMTGRLAGHYHIEFDLAELHPQQPGFWAVVGGFISDQNTPNTYVAAVRQTCKAVENVQCWRLEKLAINREIVLNLDHPL